MNTANKIEHQTETNIFTAFLSSTTLQIEVNCKTSRKNYRRSLHQDDLPKDIQTNLKNIEIIWECLQDVEAIEIDLIRRVVTLTSFVGRKKKPIEIKTQIQLDENQHLNDEQLRKQFHLLKQQVASLKIAVENSHKLQKLFQKQLTFLSEKIQKVEKNTEYRVKQMFEKQKNLILFDILNKTDEKIIEETNLKNSISQQIESMKNYQKKFQQCQARVKNMTKSENDHSKQKLKIQASKQKNNIKKEQKPKPNKKEEPIKNVIPPATEKKNGIHQENVDFPFSLQSEYIKYFKIKQNLIQYQGANKKWTILMGKEKIKKNSIRQYKFRISKATFRNISISIGILDMLKLAKSRRALGSSHSITYIGDQGAIFHNEKVLQFGHSFRVKDNIIMVMNTIKGTIEYNIEGNKLSSNHFSDWILNSNKQIVPFIELYRTGDEVQWFY